MNRFKKSALAATLSLVCAAATAAPVTYVMDPNHTDVVATWSHLGFSNPMAHFGDVDGTIVYDAANVAKSSVSATIPLTGLNAHVERFDPHLRCAELFDIGNFPPITFQSTKVESVSDTKLRVTGDLTARGVTKPVSPDSAIAKQSEHQARAAAPAIIR